MRTVEKPIVIDGANNAETKKRKPTLMAAIQAMFKSQRKQFNVGTRVHIPGGSSKKFKGYDRENRKYNSFNKKKR